jgi:hypothetical protein
VLDAAVAKAYGGQREDRVDGSVRGREVLQRYNTWLLDETVDAFKEYLVGIKGPLTTPIGGGIRSLNVALRQLLDLYVCLRPVRWFQGVPSPVKRPQDVDMVIFRENTEDIYTGLEFEQGTPRRRPKFLELLKEHFPKDLQEDPLPGHRRHQREAGVARGHGAPGAGGHEVRGREQAQERDPGAQGQHHEVHRGRLHEVGLRAGQARVRRGGDRQGPVVQAAQWHRGSRTSSRTSASSSR